MSRRALLRLVFVVAWVAGLGARPAVAHEIQPGFLELRESGPETFDVFWKIPAAGELRLAIRLRPPIDAAPTGEVVSFRDDDAWIERATLHRPGGFEGQSFSVDGLKTARTEVLVRISRVDGSSRTLRLTPLSPSFIVAGSRSGLEIVRTYLVLGIEHIVRGVDHLLFVFGLLLLVRSGRALAGTITAFTLAHSATLALATLGVATTPVRSIEVVIALSILILGVEVARSRGDAPTLMSRRPWLAALAFGLLHGFGFAGGLTVLGLPRVEVVLGLFWFNVGVEVGQLGFVLVVIAMVRSFRELELRWPRWAVRIPDYAVGVAGAYWTVQRAFPWSGGP